MDPSKLTELATKKKAAGDELFLKLTTKLQNNETSFSGKEKNVEKLLIICKKYGEALEERDTVDTYSYCVRLYRLLRISKRRYPSLASYMKEKARKTFALIKSKEKTEVKEPTQTYQLTFSFM